MTASDKQLDLMLRLADERQVSDVQGTRLAGLILAHREDGEKISMSKASQILDWLLAQPYRDQAPRDPSGLDLSDLAEGRYAVGDVLFQIQAPEAGRWQGWVFVKNGSEYADEKFGSQKPGQTYRGVHSDLIGTILEDPIEALTHYGRITGRCGVCGRTLEDEVSVARGIGPICWGRLA